MENEKYFDVDQFEENVTTEEPEEKLAVNEAKKPGFIRRTIDCAKRNKKTIAKIAIGILIGGGSFLLGRAIGKRDDNDGEVEDDPAYLPEPEEEADYDEDEIEEENFDSDTDEESEE